MADDCELQYFRNDEARAGEREKAENYSVLNCFLNEQFTFGSLVVNMFRAFISEMKFVILLLAISWGVSVAAAIPMFNISAAGNLFDEIGWDVHKKYIYHWFLSPVFNCDAVECPENHEWSECASYCEPQCNGFRGEKCPMNSPDVCMFRCVCQPGYSRIDEHNCAPIESDDCGGLFDPFIDL